MSKASSLLSAAAVRARARAMLALCEAGAMAHWQLDRARLPAAADYVVETIRLNYPSLDIPFHARWRHFAAAGKDRWAALGPWPDAESKACAALDLAIVSVLLDAGAGPDWRYSEPDGTVTARSEGLGVASFAMFAEGAFSADARQPWRVDAARLAALTPDAIARGFQVRADNPLVGLEGRAGLLNALGRACLAKPDVFTRDGATRPGHLFDVLARDTVPAPTILSALLTHLGPIWPSRLSLDGVPLGDTWRYPPLATDDATSGLVPFHKLSQWMAYSLIEPLQDAGIAVTDIDGLTGLPEYRNGGLFIDMGVIAPKDAREAGQPQTPDSALIVEWRALTVALLDEIAVLVRERLGMDAAALPLARVLEGGTWAAGRRIAREKRASGGPPLAIVSDGTVF